MPTTPTSRRLPFLPLALAAGLLLAACGQGGEAAPTGEALPPTRADAPAAVGLGACLRLLPGETLASPRSNGDAATAALRHADGSVDVYVGPLPDFPGFRRVTRGLADTPTADFVAIAEAREQGRRFALAGFKREGQPRLYAMLSGAEAMFPATIDASRFIACR